MASYGKRLFRVFGFPLFYLFLNLHSLTDAAPPSLTTAGRQVLLPQASLRKNPVRSLPVSQYPNLPVPFTDPARSFRRWQVSPSLPVNQSLSIPISSSPSHPSFQSSILPFFPCRNSSCVAFHRASIIPPCIVTFFVYFYRLKIKFEKLWY